MDAPGSLPTLPDPLDVATEIAKAIGHRTRLLALERLAQRPCAVTELARALGLSITTLSAQLQVLRAAGLVVDNEDGTYTVKPYKDGTRHDVVVDGDFLLNDKEQPAFAGGGKNATALWPLLVEKAVAQDFGGYDAIVGDQGNRAMEILLGEHPTQDINSQAGIMGRVRNWGDTDYSDEDMRTMVVDDHYVVTACTERGPVKYFELEGGGTVTIQKDHCYQVADVDQASNGQYYVTLVNPWNSPDYPGGGGDVITFAMDEFRGKFREINWASTR